MNVFGIIDWFVFFSIFAFIVLALYFSHKAQSRSKINPNSRAYILEYFLMGRRLTLPFFIATLVATWYGGIFGVTRITFEQGIYSFLTQGIFWYISYIIFALFLVSKVRSYKALTLPDLVGKMVGPKSAKLSAVFNFFNVVPVTYAISLGIFLQIVFQLDFLLAVSLGVSFSIFYSAFGGFRAIVFTDVVQFLVMFSSVIIIVILSIQGFGGLGFLQEHLPESHFSFLGDAPLSTTFIWGFIALSTLVDPNFYQRCFAADSTRTAQLGIISSTVIWVIFDICTTVGALYARAVMPDADPKSAYLVYALEIAPPGFRGFIVGGIICTILSTIDSYLLIAGTSISFDLFPKKITHSRIRHYISITFVGLLSILLAAFFEGNIKQVWKVLGGYSAACLLFPILLGYILPRKIGDKQFVLACLAGVFFMTIWSFIDRSGFWKDIDEFYVGLFATGIAYQIGYCWKEKSHP